MMHIYSFAELLSRPAVLNRAGQSDEASPVAWASLTDVPRPRSYAHSITPPPAVPRPQPDTAAARRLRWFRLGGPACQARLCVCLGVSNGGWVAVFALAGLGRTDVTVGLGRAAQRSAVRTAQHAA